MNRIILDELRRRWWFWGLVGLSCLVFGACAAVQKNDFYGAVYPAFLTIQMLGLHGRYGRFLLTLPLTARQIGRAFWVLYVGIASLLLVLFTGLGVLIYGYFATSPGSLLGIWFRLAVVGSLGFGSFFWIFSGVSSSPPEGKAILRVPLFGYGFAFLFALIVGGFLLARSALSDELKLLIICLVGVCLTVLGWFRAERLVIEFAASRKELLNVGKPKRMFKPRAGYGGIPFLIINCCIRYIGAAVFFTVLIFGVILFFNLAFPDPDKLTRSDIYTATKVIQCYSLFLGLWMVLPITVFQKSLRSLPLTSKKHAAVILCLPIVPFFALCGIVALFVVPIFGVPAALSVLKGDLLYLPPVCVIAIAFVWNYEKTFARIVVAGIVFAISAIPLVFQLIRNTGHDLPLWMILGFPLVSCFLAFYIINRLLTWNDMTYRAQLQTFIEPGILMW